METAKTYIAKWNAFPQPKKINILKGIAFACYAISLLLFVIFVFGRNGKQQTPEHNLIVFMHPASENLYALRYLAQRHDVHVPIIVLGTSNNSHAKSDLNMVDVEAFITKLRADGYNNNNNNDNDSIARLFGGVNVNDLQEWNLLQEESIADNVAHESRKVIDHVQKNTSVPLFMNAIDSYLSSHTASLLILGPCTDAAYYINYSTPEMHKHVNEILVAGGAFTVSGDAHYYFPLNSNNKAEKNFYADPHAANFIVEGSHHIPVTILPLDATFAWPEQVYQTLITDVLKDSKCNASTLTATRALYKYYTETEQEQQRILQSFVAINKEESGELLEKRSRLLTLEMLAAAYAADHNVQNQVKVTEIAVSVTHKVSDNTNGVSYRPANNPYNFNAKVVLEIKQDNF